MICDYFKVQRILSSKTIRDGMLLNRYKSPRYLTIQQSKFGCDLEYTKRVLLVCIRQASMRDGLSLS